jgi:hypothetical protein
VLLRFLVEQVKQIAHGGARCDLEPSRSEHERHEIDGRHSSRFGDPLGPILREALGRPFRGATVAAWCEAFQAIVQEMQADGLRGPSTPAAAEQIPGSGIERGEEDARPWHRVTGR